MVGVFYGYMWVATLGFPIVLPLWLDAMSQLKKRYATDYRAGFDDGWDEGYKFGRTEREDEEQDDDQTK